MGTLDLRYALPRSRVRIHSTVTTNKDSVLDSETRVPQSTAVLEMGADSRTNELKATTGAIFNTGVSLELNDEGLLKASSLESSGELGKVVLGVVGAATTVAGALVSPAGIGAGVAHGVLAFDRTVDVIELEKPTPNQREQREAAAFAENHPEAAALRDRLQALVEQVRSEMLMLAEVLAGTDNPEERGLARKRFLVLQGLQEVLKAQLTELNELFKAWRATTIETRTEEFERLISLDEIHAAKATLSDDGTMCFCGEASTAIDFAWSKLGIAVTVDPPAQRVGLPPTGKNRILVRIPRQVTIDVYEKDADGRAVLKQSKPALVMDSGCKVEVIKLRKSFWAKRNVSVKFSELGALSAYTYQADSSAAAFASTAGSLPGTVTASLENALKARETIGSLETSGTQQQLAKVKAEADLKLQELTKQGLNATAEDYAKLERLKQRAAMLEQRKSIRDARYTEPVVDEVAAEIAQLKQQVELLKLRAKLDQLS